ncbi:unnamed protein product [Echinostoma caproni]|uniref:BAG domain-containing protein n=1 Tax=Echinostoma caproni TaxID=27848 RepID=A0A183A5Y4_9TREM|nr:unnamed protein product [Echinostoma caproni]
MIGYVTIDVYGANMDSASRHAQRLANNFLDDLDTMQRASRARDRRAMSHLETGVRSTSVFENMHSPIRRRRSLTTTRIQCGPPTELHYTWPAPPTTDYPTIYRRPRIVRQYAPSVMMVGKSVYSAPVTRVSYYPPRADWVSQGSNVYDTHRDWRSRFWYDQIVANPEQALPTSSLRAHSPPKQHIFSPEEPFPRVIHTAVSRRTPLHSTRLRSVPPPTVTSTYRPIFYTSDIGVPASAPRTYYRTHRYVSETPYYLSSYTTRTSEPTKPILSTHYTSAPAPVTHRYTYYHPSVVTGKVYTPYRTGSYSYLTPEVQHERRRIERRMDDLLDYKLPSPEYFRDMRGSLRHLQDRLDEHRRLVDKYSGIDMNVAPSSVEDRIESKYQQLASRVACLVDLQAFEKNMPHPDADSRESLRRLLQIRSVSYTDF